MKPYKNAVLNPQQRYFNYRLSRGRIVTEGAYGQLKGRWRLLLRKKNESDKEHVRTATLACMVLHNVCLMKKGLHSKKARFKNWSTWQWKGNKDEIRRLLLMREFRSVHGVLGEATRVRDALCGKLLVEKETGRVS